MQQNRKNAKGDEYFCKAPLDERDDKALLSSADDD